MRPMDFFDRHPVFTHGEFVSAHTATGRSANTSNTLLHKHVAAGRILRVRRGLYATVPRGANPQAAPVDPYLLATALADDAVVAYHAALRFHGKAYSVSRRFHYLTCARTRPFSFRGSDFVPVRVAASLRDLSDLGGGILEQQHAGGTVRVTTLERTLVDVLAAPDKGAGWEEVWRSLELVEFFDLDAVIDYARNLDSAVAAARVGFFLEQHREVLMVEDAHLESLKKLGPNEPRYFDPRRRPGKLVPRWNLVVPEQVLSRTWGEVL
ncbi:MAG: type IV toxin-antitoxin system AbiEi family antitoxin domain-containing protein [Polyangiaceae bacterium]|nr:type IV toxin-antitoxin system AbiEi family antitoxin domain-containing protein [Polyangiaceae bacterium]